MYHRVCSWSSWTIPADIVVATWAKNCERERERERKRERERETDRETEAERERETERQREGSKNISNLKNLNSNAPEKLSPATLVTNFHKSLLLPLVVRPWQKTKIGFDSWVLLLLLKISYIFIASTKDLNVLQMSTEN